MYAFINYITIMNSFQVYKRVTRKGLNIIYQIVQGLRVCDKWPSG